MWGQNWGTMIWGATVGAPAMSFWGTLLLGAILGISGVRFLKKTRPRTVGLVVLGLALLAPIAARALPSLSTFSNGTVANATQVNANFQAVSVVTVNGVSYSVGATTYCGLGPTTTGSFSFNGLTSYAAAKAMCAAATSCGSSSTAHMCTGDEMVRSSSLGISMPTQGWYATFMTANNVSGVIGDCAGFTSTSSASYGPVGGGFPTSAPGYGTCNTSWPLLCCN